MHTLSALGRSELGLEAEPPFTATATVLPNDCHGSNPEPADATATTATTRKGGSGSSSNGRVALLSGQGRNGVSEVVNAALAEPEELP